MWFGFDAIAFAEQARQAGMRDGNVQAIRIIVADIFPINRTRAHGDAAKRLQFLKPIGRDLRLIRLHHFGNRRPAAFQSDKDKPAPDFHVDGHKAGLILVERRVRGAIGDAS